MTISSERGFTVLLPSSARSGPLRDGRYQSKVLVNGTPVALLNWSIGGRGKARARKPLDAPEKAAASPAADGAGTAFPAAPTEEKSPTPGAGPEAMPTMPGATAKEDPAGPGGGLTEPAPRK